MLFSRSFIASALLGLAVATNHEGESAAVSSVAVSSVAASESLVTGHSSALASASATVTAAESAVHSSAAASVVHSSAAPSASAAAGTVKTHVIQVGGPNGTLIFSPENIVAQAGDLVQFQFNPKNHSVVQSTFDQPCVPITNILANKTDAFYSGFMPSNATAVAAGNQLTYTIRVMDAKPIWFYCSQGQHCQAGMVGAINAAATGNKTMAAFKQLAAAAVENLSPGQAPGSGVQPPAPGASESAAAGGGAGATPSAAGSPTSSSVDSPPVQTDNPAVRISASSLGLGLSLFAAFFAL